MDNRSSTSSFSTIEPVKEVRPPPTEDVAGSVFLISASGEVLRLPIPSSSPRDPLAWTLATRITAFICVICLGAGSGVTINIPATIMPGLEYDFPDRVDSWFTGKSVNLAMTFFVAVGFLIAIPLSVAVGRRPVILATTSLMAIMVLWAGFSGAFWQLMVANCFQGIAAGGTISMSLLIIMDATFIHERPYAFSLFWGSGGLILAGAFIPFPFILDPQTQWRPMYHIWFGPCVVLILLALLFVPETFFIRPPIAFDGRVLEQTSSERIKIYESWESMPCGPHCPHREHTQEAPGKSSWSDRLKIRRAPGTSWKGAVATYFQMALCLTNPLLVWVSLLSAAILSGVIFMHLMLPMHLVRTLPPPEREVLSIFLGISCILGSLLAIPATGPLITWCTKYLTLRSGGTRHAEVYLPSFVLPVLASNLSVGLFGLAALNDWPTPVYYFAFSLSIFSYVTTNVAVILWITEAFPPWAAASLAVQMFTCNIVAFGVGINLLAWVQIDEGALSNIIIVVLVLVLGAFAVPIAFWGQKVRQYIHGKWSESEKGAIRPR